MEIELSSFLKADLSLDQHLLHPTASTMPARSSTTWSPLLFSLATLLLFNLNFASASPSSPRAQSTSSPPIVHLPYATVSGYYNSTSNLDVFSSIRYAAPPVGENRWRIAQSPKDERGKGTVDVSKYPPRCPQATGVSPYLFSLQTHPRD